MHNVPKWSDTLMKAVVKYRKHLTIAIALEFAKKWLSFNMITIENTPISLYFAMLQNGQTHFKNLAANTARFLRFVWPFYDIA